MQLRQIESPEKWTEFWLEKLAAELEKRNCPPSDIIARKNIIRQYLSKNPGNPRMVDLKKMLDFVALHKAESIEPLTFFYTSVSHSEKHIDALSGVVIKESAPEKKKKTPAKSPKPPKTEKKVIRKK
jgi:hypothetical protein